jgi:hypothetical protein
MQGDIQYSISVLFIQTEGNEGYGKCKQRKVQTEANAGRDETAVNGC